MGKTSNICNTLFKEYLGKDAHGCAGIYKGIIYNVS
jgi:hypothetical protein